MAYKDYEELNKRQQPGLRSRMGNSQAVSANQAQALRNPRYTTASGNTVQNSIRQPLGGGGIMDARGPAQRGQSFNIPRQQMYVKAPAMNLGAGGLALGAAQQMWNNPNVQRNNQNVENSLANMGGKTGIFGTPNNSVDFANSVDLAGAASNFGGKALDFFIPKAYGDDRPYQPLGGEAIARLQSGPTDTPPAFIYGNGLLPDTSGVQSGNTLQTDDKSAMLANPVNALNAGFDRRMRRFDKEGVFPAIGSGFDAGLGVLKENIVNPVADALGGVSDYLFLPKHERGIERTQAAPQQTRQAQTQAIKTPPEQAKLQADNATTQATSIQPEYRGNVNALGLPIQAPGIGDSYTVSGGHGSEGITLADGRTFNNPTQGAEATVIPWDASTDTDFLARTMPAEQYRELMGKRGLMQHQVDLSTPRQGESVSFDERGNVRSLDSRQGAISPSIPNGLGFDPHFAERLAAQQDAPFIPVTLQDTDMDGGTSEYIQPFNKFTGQTPIDKVRLMQQAQEALTFYKDNPKELSRVHQMMQQLGLTL